MLIVKGEAWAPIVSRIGDPSKLLPFLPSKIAVFRDKKSSLTFYIIENLQI